MTPFAGIVGMCALFTLVFMFMSARAITIWSGSRRGPRWATFFGQFAPEEAVETIPRREALGYAGLAGVVEFVLAYAAAHPLVARFEGSAVIAVQIGLAVIWATYFSRLPKRVGSAS
jgi:hypothetical protein